MIETWVRVVHQRAGSRGAGRHFHDAQKHLDESTNRRFLVVGCRRGGVRKVDSISQVFDADRFQMIRCEDGEGTKEAGLGWGALSTAGLGSQCQRLRTYTLVLLPDRGY